MTILKEVCLFEIGLLSYDVTTMFRNATSSSIQDSLLCLNPRFIYFPRPGQLWDPETLRASQVYLVHRKWILWLSRACGWAKSFPRRFLNLQNMTNWLPSSVSSSGDSKEHEYINRCCPSVEYVFSSTWNNFMIMIFSFRFSKLSTAFWTRFFQI